ncbi:MAG: DUF2127 domain-containing protein [Anaeromyxobacteraceae bacterium]
MPAWSRGRRTPGRGPSSSTRRRSRSSCSRSSWPSSRSPAAATPRSPSGSPRRPTTTSRTGSRFWVSRALGLVAQGHRLRLVELGLAFEAALSTLEAWALHRGRRWGAWLVLVASLSPVPWEVRAIVHRASPVRLAVLLVNLGIAAYLARGLWRERHAASRPGGPPPGGPD